MHAFAVPGSCLRSSCRRWLQLRKETIATVDFKLTSAAMEIRTGVLVYLSVLRDCRFALSHALDQSRAGS